MKDSKLYLGAIVGSLVTGALVIGICYFAHKSVTETKLANLERTITLREYEKYNEKIDIKIAQVKAEVKKEAQVNCEETTQLKSQAAANNAKHEAKKIHDKKMKALQDSHKENHKKWTVEYESQKIKWNQQLQQQQLDNEELAASHEALKMVYENLKSEKDSLKDEVALIQKKYEKSLHSKKNVNLQKGSIYNDAPNILTTALLHEKQPPDDKPSKNKNWISSFLLILDIILKYVGIFVTVKLLSKLIYLRLKKFVFGK